MIVSIQQLGGTKVYFAFPGTFSALAPLYYYLQDVGDIVESTSKESGNATVILALEVFKLLPSVLGRLVEILADSGEVLFEGIITDATINSNILLQLEA
jgi:hypothetical protein